MVCHDLPAPRQVIAGPPRSVEGGRCRGRMSIRDLRISRRLPPLDDPDGFDEVGLLSSTTVPYGSRQSMIESPANTCGLSLRGRHQ
jgi:hypothetical protein